MNSILWLSVLLIPLTIFAAGDSTKGQILNPVNIVMGLLGGLALFLYGMELMSDGLKKAAGEKMKLILAALSKNRFLGVLTGTVTTAIIQSSSVTTVLLVGFVSAGLMSLSQSVSIIFGANIGTTITAQIIAFKVTKYALLMIAVGFGMLFFSKKEAIRQYGSILLGLGLVFYGMSVMSGTMKPLRTNEEFIHLMANMSNPFLGILTAALFTALVQSSSATTGVVIVLAMQGIISLEAGIALSLGANIGTCITAGVASIGKRREAVRVAMVHVFFNTAGVLLILPFISPFAELARSLSPLAESSLPAREALAAVVPRQIANAHTLFNVTMALIFLPFTTQLAQLLNRVLPDKAMLDESTALSSRYLDETLLNTPELALEAVYHECMRIGNRISVMFTTVLPYLKQGKKDDHEILKTKRNEIEKLEAMILQFLRELNASDLNPEQSQKLMNLLSNVNHLENMSEFLFVEIFQLHRKMERDSIKMNTESIKKLEPMIEETIKAFQNTMEALENQDSSKAKKVAKMKDRISETAEAYKQQQALELLGNKEGKIESYRIEIAMIDILKRVFYHTRRIARRI
ncbi:MAG: Na/Pi cotransporter family protein [SAR324 cluster bacterium]|nr:Na/Pi cotransporter family protein [SAR324 cluster bacterium]MEE1575122.1 Na/Pi cotransporter family protein [Deltaproteobacteria bacterium]MDP6245533.1 Na/Pi cotransporter family protein [SAR324 cluster bacterium]MDP6462568.1 Na/Pi cotransporter family protein [SAR324 cluster bacterium]MDP7139964.1 Na/Pi cotransporter family protein [SAR324 cluster bacterium]